LQYFVVAALHILDMRGVSSLILQEKFSQILYGFSSYSTICFYFPAHAAKRRHIILYIKSIDKGGESSMSDDSDFLKDGEERKSSSRKWMVHVHSYETGVDPELGHQHRLLGVTCPAKEARRRFHVHTMPGRTTFSGTNSIELHWHAYEVVTEIETEMPDGNHVHFYSGVTSVDAGHSHTFSGATNVGPDVYFQTAGVSSINNKFKKCKRPDEEGE
jgi:hypothetical protein